MQTKFFVLAATMICAVSMAANNKVSGVIKDAANKTALIGVNVTLVESQIHRAKILRDGQIFILRGDKTYTITGIEVK